jgi:nucleoside-diphosphate-sugar epimerase|uniref:Thioester reductase (TE) domain-containing protein n=2 Tax=Ostreococcus mediterraneus TaxID=1486918 RepID=A0A6T5SUC3_9CHLO|eukprot:CAMPEP_0179724358 /NCGR_PEP_ID=MMETSP0938-20121108/5981_1 /TAXON_ID=548131 ORGANISM="Ostreococcus mediterraneus, Strain clade-D-RCC1107" /NCGR_SAMPLE_ID=MMETSP0938 /ASSEMBLY_ACC=CAM_ASM_000576 /LENGTH=485 /DNA_ID=CAMNT_0021598385 /DNA_START=202 /DNA_END=1659 /DNA_ORIENTATION=-
MSSSRPFMEKILQSGFINTAREGLLNARPKSIALSGPGGFLGARVLSAILDAHEFRRFNGVEPGEVLLLSASPGNLMSRLTKQYGVDRLKTVRASRVDYYHQHDVDSWQDQLGSLGMAGCNSVFMNLAGLAGPVSGRPDAMMAVNYRAPVAAGRACENLGFGHFIQSSTQATKAERAGQVPYSRWKAMADFSLARLQKLPVTICALGMLYDKEQGVVGQRGDLLNMIDLTLLPLTPIMGDGSAPLQPLEVADAANRLAYLSLTEVVNLPIQSPRGANADAIWSRESWASLISRNQRQFTLRMYDAVGPDKMTMLELNKKFAELNHRKIRPVHVDYRNFERVLNVASLGNLNRQFVSLLRSEQDAKNPVVGNPTDFEAILGPNAKLCSLNDLTYVTQRRRFPYAATLGWALQNYGVIWPGILLGTEIFVTYFFGAKRAHEDYWIYTRAAVKLAALTTIAGSAAMFGSESAAHILDIIRSATTPPKM